MAILRLDIEGNPKTIAYRTFIGIANDSFGILNDIDHAFSRRRNGALDWYVNDLSSNGKLRLEIYCQVRRMKRKQLPDVGGEVTASFVSGFSVLEREGKSPEYLTDYGMEKAKDLTRTIGDHGPRAIIASVPETSAAIEITHRAAKNLERLIPEAYYSVGSVEGRLETISVHGGRPRFYVYLGLSNKAVRCDFRFSSEFNLLPKIKDTLGQRVQVLGRVYRNAKGEPTRVVMEKPDSLRAFGIDLEILPFNRLGGVDPNFTDDLSTEEFIGRIRG